MGIRLESVHLKKTQPDLKRILLIGSGGAGKSTLSKKLGELWMLPVVHLDKLFWQPGWQPLPRPEFIEKVKIELSKPEWIIDGNYDSSINLRAEHADLIIFLDYSNVLCVYRACKRAWINRGTTRSDMGEGCPEKIDWEFVRWIWRFRKDARPDILIELEKCHADVLSFKSPRELEQWITIQSINVKSKSPMVG